MVEMVRTVINGEYEMILPKHRADRAEWYIDAGYEKKRLASMHRNLNSSDIIYYIGAEEGEMVALCQMWGAKSVMFEPNTKAWPNIRAVWEANELKHPLGIFAGFASDETKEAEEPIELTFSLGLGADGWPLCAHQEIVGDHGFKELDKEAKHYPQMKIDDYVEKTGITPTALSIDVEGSEGKVIRGAEKTLRTYHPKIWLSGHPEFLHDQYDGAGGFHYLRELRDWLKKELGYQEELLDFDHEVHMYYY